MKRLAHIFGVWLAFAAISFGQQSSSNYDPGKQNRPRNSNQSFVDFTLGRLNPTDKDYGQCFDEARVLLVEETVKSVYFWSNVVSLGLASCLFIIAVYQHRQANERELTVAEVLQQYEHALTRANNQVAVATRRNGELIETLTTTRESAFGVPLTPVVLQESVVGRTAKQPATGLETTSVSGTTGVAMKAAETSGSGVDVGNQISLFKPEVDFILKVNSLEQQLERSQEQQKQLRRQLNQADQRLQTEQQKNRTLKGA